MGKLQVLVIGAGTGGLALAHGLRASGIAVRVFERDHSLTERAQGYRLTINPRGARALQSCLPKTNFEHYVAASAKVSTAVSFFDHKLRRLLCRSPKHRADRSMRRAAHQPCRIAPDSRRG